MLMSDEKDRRFVSYTERWPSGLRRTPGKCVGAKVSRRFESCPLRQYYLTVFVPVNGTMKPIMLMLQFFSWWYGRGLAGLIGRIRGQLRAFGELFSVNILLRTLFAPWRRIISYPGAGLGDHMRALLDNLISRLVGFIIRIFVLLAAAVSVIVLGVLWLAELVVWPLLPPAIVACLILGVVT